MRSSGLADIIGVGKDRIANAGVGSSQKLGGEKVCGGSIVHT